MKRAALLLLVLLAVAPYAGSLSDPLMYDDRTALDSAWLKQEAGAGSVFRHDFWYGTSASPSDLYRPLTVLSLAWNMRLAPTRFGIRAVNIAAHAGAVVALFLLLARIVPRATAWIGAALFAVHPLSSESVLWAVGRAEIFAMILGVAAFGLFLEADRREDPGGLALIGSVAAFLAALFFKESAAAWLVIGTAWVVLDPPDRRPARRLVAARALAYVPALGVYLALRGLAVGGARHDVPWVDNPLVRLDPATRAVNAVLLFGRYLAKMVWPATLSVDYGFDQIPVAALGAWIIPAFVLVAVLVAAILILRRRGQRVAAFLVAFVPCAFAVTGNLAFPIGTNFAERLAYTPLAGFCGIAAIGLAAVPSRRWRSALVAAVLLAGGARTFARTADYRSLAVFTEATADASPRAVKALANAGRTRLRAGDAAGARPLLERAVTIWPEYPRGWLLLADACAALNDDACAVRARDQAKIAAEATRERSDPL